MKLQKSSQKLTQLSGLKPSKKKILENFRHYLSVIWKSHDWADYDQTWSLFQKLQNIAPKVANQKLQELEPILEEKIQKFSKKSESKLAGLHRLHRFYQTAVKFYQKRYPKVLE